MTNPAQLLLTLLSFASFATAAPLVFEGTEGPGKGKHIVFIADDHEYRSEESLPAMARILAKHHGFKCTVLFDIDPDGNIAAGEPQNIPGMEALDSADLAVVFLRFQGLPPEQMKHSGCLPESRRSRRRPAHGDACLQRHAGALRQV
jgi:hypothetical protein